jgi:cytochrome c-type biogenesis protein
VVPIVLGVFLKAITAPPVETVLVVGAYAGGLSLLMVATTVATGVGVFSSTSRLIGYGTQLQRIAGVIMIGTGLGQLYLSVVILDVL